MKPSGTLWGSWALKPFWSPVSCRPDSRIHYFPWGPKGRFKQLLIKGGAVKKPRRQSKGLEFIRIRRPTTWDPTHAFIVLATPLLNHFYKTPPQMSLDWDTVFRGQSLLCPPLTDKAIKPSFSTSPKTLVSEIWFGTRVRRGWAFRFNGSKKFFPLQWI